MKKRFFLGLFIILFLLLWQFEKPIRYGFSQLMGQASVLWSRRAVESLAGAPEGQPYRVALHQITSIRRYGQTMGLRVEDAYTRVCLPGTFPRLVVLTAAPTFSTRAKTWWYPIIGRLPYRGYFSPTLLKQEMQELRRDGFDVDTGEVQAWSGLGWYSDPIMPGMLRGNEATRAETLLHELVHKTFFVSGAGTFNENLAEFLGEKLAMDYLVKQYGPASKPVLEAHRGTLERNLRLSLWEKAGHTLDSVYQQTRYLNSTIRAHKKHRALVNLSGRIMRETGLPEKQRTRMILHLLRGGNATVSGHRTYFQLFDSLENALAVHHKGNLNDMIRYCKNRYSD